MAIETMLMVAVIGLAGLTIAVAAALRGWQGWLELRKMEIARAHGEIHRPTGGRIEIADLKERVRKLEAIAAGIEY